MSLTLLLVAGALSGIGTWLVMQRTLTRVVLGLGLMGHGAVALLLFVGGRAGEPAFVGGAEPAEMAAPLPQALVLTAIVISFGFTALMLALAHRSWTMTRDDEVRDDLEDRRVGRAREHDIHADFDESELATEFEDATDRTGTALWTGEQTR